MAKTTEKDVLMNHDYDGIRELDNDLPPWWLWLFYITIIWSVIYLVYFHVLGIGDLQHAEYMKEVDPNWTAPAQVASGSMVPVYHSPFYVEGLDLTPRQKADLLVERITAAKQAEVAAKGLDGQVDVNELAFSDLLRAAMVAATPENRQKLLSAYPDKLGFDEIMLAAILAAKPEDQQRLKDMFPEVWALHTGEPGAAPSVASAPAAAAPVAKMEALTDQASLDAGKLVFMTNCLACHGANGEGGVGPNLTDDYWLHGAGVANMVNTITNGVPIKGMISWKPILKPEQIHQVASYILTLHGTNPPNGKAPQGEKVEYPLN
jgi:mono/diheme cytochrome c family protein